MKKFKLFAVLCLIAVITCSAMAGCNKNNHNNSDPSKLDENGNYVICSFNSPYLNVAPDSSVSDDFDPTAIYDYYYDAEPTTDEAFIKMAVDIYELANSNDQFANGRMFFSTCTSSNNAAGMDNKIDLIIFELKDANEYFRIDYRVKNSIPLFDNPLTKPMEKTLNDSLNLVLTERIYYDLQTGGECIKQTVKNAQTDEKNMPYADWTNPISDVVAVPVFSGEQDGEYQRCSHSITRNTVTKATITHNDEEGYFSISLTVDTSKACEETNKGIRDGSGDPNAEYTELLVEFEVWDSGYYKSYHEYNKWKGKAAKIIDINSSFDYHDVYSYNVADYDIDTFADAKAAKAAYTAK